MNLRKNAESYLPVKLITAILLSLGFIGITLFLMTLNQAEFAVQKGFLGTRAFLLSDLNLIAQLVLLAGLSIGVLLARRGHYRAHQYMQTTVVLLNLTLVLSIMVGSFVRTVAPGMPGNIATLFGMISVLHAGNGLLAVACSVYLLLRMNQLIPERMRIKNWKNLMRLTFGLYWTVGLLGLALYLIWYVK